MSTGFSFGQAVAPAPSAAPGFPISQPAAAGAAAPAGFSFGQVAAAAPAGGGFNFGQTAAPQSGFGLGQPATSTGGGFGGFPAQTATPAVAGGGFGGFAAQTAPPAAAGGFGGFAGQTATPAVAGGFGGFAGQTAAPAAAGGFGGFATQTATPAVAGFGLAQPGQSAAPAFGLAQPGQSAAPAFGLAQPGQSAAPAFGCAQPGQSAAPAFNLNQPAAQAFNINQAAAVSSTGAFNLGQSTTPSGAFNLSQPAVAAAQPVGGGFSFGQTSTPAAGAFTLPQPQSTGSTFNLGQTATTGTGLNFSAPAVAATAPTGIGNFSFAGTATTPASTASTGIFNLGQVTATPVAPNAAAPLGGFSFGGTPSAAVAPVAPSSGLFSLGGAGGLTSAAPPAIVPTSGFSLSGFGTKPANTAVVSATAVAPFLGLGGSVAPTSSTPLAVTGGLGGSQPPTAAGLTLNGPKLDGKSAKETPLPQEIFGTINIFESYKNTEKTASEANVRQTAAPFHKLGEDCKKLRQHVLQLSNKHSQLQANADKLKTRVMEDAEHVEMSRRTQATPLELQGDNKDPEQYFLMLVRSFEERMRYCRTKIDEVEKCNRAANGHTDKSSDDMMEVLHHEHDTMKSLAAKVYLLHNQLIEVAQVVNAPSAYRPDALFKPRHSPAKAGKQPSSVLRPLLGDGGSGLLNFQAGQQRAKALALGGAPPPTLGLGQSQQSSLLLGMNPAGMFGTPTNGSFIPMGLNNNNNNIINNNNNTNFKFSTPLLTGNTSSTFGGLGNSTFGSPVANTFGTQPPMNNQSTLFNSLTAPTNKPYGYDEDESRRKRRL